ncbi:MAG: UbiA family prenyltransferase [Bacteroidetes bacterium]|nr:UbiA family prenyltransferase [Bacteroidota bacterium]
MKSIFQFFVFSNLFISLCAVIMGYQTYAILIGGFPDKNFLGFVFFSTICSYNFHWYLTSESLVESKRIEWTKSHKYLHLVLFIIGALGALFFFYFLKEFWPWLLISAAITFLYTAPKIPHPLFRALRKIAIGKTIFLALIWMHVTTILPVIISDIKWSAPFYLFIINRFFFIYAICIIFDFRDKADDKAAGIRSMITYFSERGVNNLFALSLLIFAITSMFLFNYNVSILTVILLLIPGGIVASLYGYAKKNLSDYLYYFVLDGLMMLSGLMILLVKLI